jgi:hypothetical protein
MDGGEDTDFQFDLTGSKMGDRRCSLQGLIQQAEDIQNGSWYFPASNLNPLNLLIRLDTSFLL